MNKLILLVIALVICGTPVQDTWDHPGRVMTPGEVYVDTLSDGDRADYYALTPEGSGYYTFYLRDLPAGTEWAALAFVAQSTYPPGYAPGPTGGLCRIATPGTQDKAVTCLLVGGIEYLVKVDGPTGIGYYTLEVNSD